MDVCYTGQGARLVLSYRNLLTAMKLNFTQFALEISQIIAYEQKQEIKVYENRDLVMLNCQLANLCMRTFDLGLIMEKSLQEELAFVVHFYSVGTSKLVYLDKNIMNSANSIQQMCL